MSGPAPGAGTGSPDTGASETPGRSYGPPPESPWSCPGYIAYITGIAVTATGSWGTQLSLLWLMLQLTDDGRLLGLLAALQYLPYLGVGLLAGVAADRFPVRRLIVAVEGTHTIVRTSLSPNVAKMRSMTGTNEDASGRDGSITIARLNTVAQSSSVRVTPL